MSRVQLNPFRSFRAGIAFSFGIAILILSVIISSIAGQTVRIRVQEDVTIQMRDLATRLAYELDQGMFERYRDVQIAATALEIAGDDLSRDEQRESIETLQDLLPDYSWIGITDITGTVTVSTGRILEGEDVSFRPWFEGAREQPFVGDVHGALLLEAYLSPEDGEPLRLVDIAMPISNEDGTFNGVLGTHLNWEWAEHLHARLLTEQLRNVDIQLFILSENNDILSQNNTNLEIIPASVMATFDNMTTGSAITTWSDDRTYLTGYASTTGYRDYPGLGWQIVTIQPTNIAFAPVRQLTTQILAIGGITGLIFIGLGWVLAGAATRPLEIIARQAEAIHSNQSEVVIPYLDDNHEVATLSRSLQKMVTDLQQEIGDRKRAQQKLQTQEAMLSTILDNVPVIIIRLTAEHEVDYINRHALELFGIDGDNIKHLNHLLDVIALSTSDLERFRALLVDRQGQWHQLDSITNQGDTLFISWSSVIQSSGEPILIGIDLTEHKRMQQELEATQFLRMTFETTYQGIIILNASHEIILVNQHMMDKLDSPEKAFIGQSVFDILSLDQAVFSQMQQTDPGNEINHATVLQQKDGENLTVDVTVYPVEINRSTYFVVFVADIDISRQELETEKQRLQRDLQNRFVKLVSHEFRTPLAVINTSADLMLRYLRHMDDPRINERLGIVQSQVNRMVELMQAGLTHINQEQQQPELNRQVYSMQSLIEPIADIVSEKDHPTQPLNFKVARDDIRVDAALFEQIIHAILENASQYSPDSSTISLTATLQDEQWQIAIHDQGIGIPDNDMPFIFEPFFRSDNATKYPGMGLGLALVKRNVALLDGIIDITSDRDQGTTVTFTLPQGDVYH